MLPSYQQILRVFGMSGAQIAAILRAAREDGCPGLRLLERDGEYAVCVQVSAPTQAMAREYCENWCARLRRAFGDALYAEGEINLAQATLDVLLQKRVLTVAANETTGRLLGARLRSLPHSEAVFDFGHTTYADPRKAARIVAPTSVVHKYPGDAVQEAAGRAAAALAVSGADLAALYQPSGIGQEPFALVCDKREACALPVDPELTDAALGNVLLDLLRRRASGLSMPNGGIVFSVGHDRPPLGDALQPTQKTGDTTRFSIRRKHTQTPKGKPDGQTAVQAAGREYEPMLDFDQPAKPDPLSLGTPLDFDAPLPQSNPDRDLVASKAHAAAQENWNRTEPVGAISFETEDERQNDVARITDANAAGNAGETVPQDPEISHRASSGLLDDDTPEFVLPTPRIPPPTAGMPLHTEQEMSDAATLLFDRDPGGRAVDKKKAQDKRAQAAAQSTAPSYPQAGQSPSLVRMEKRERNRRRFVILLLVLFVLILVMGVVGVVLWNRESLGKPPAPATYGTVGHDRDAMAYLAKARQKRAGVLGYLSFPGQEGQLLYADVQSADAAKEEAEVTAPYLEGDQYLTSDAPGHTIVRFSDGLNAFLTLETVRQNSGFTLYANEEQYRCKVFAVFQTDPSETGATAFDPFSYGDLSNLYDYLAFALGAQVRSLYDTGVQPGHGADFITFVQDQPDGTRLWVTGRVVKATESPTLRGDAIEQAEQPLYCASRYAADGQPLPDVRALLAAQLERYALQRDEIEAQQDIPDAKPENQDNLDDMVSALQQQTNSLLQHADEVMMQGLTDIAGNAGASESDIGQGAEGTMPQQDVAIPEPPAAPTPQPLPSAPLSSAPVTETASPAAPGDAGSESADPATPPESPTGAPSEDPQLPPAPLPTPSASLPVEPQPSLPVQPTAQPTPQPSPTPFVETIDVTMNGKAQSMELVQCLAMIAQNELGAKAPLEAYKAQCVAAHCWILSQGDYPPVTGTTPGKTALQAAQEVAHVLVTYNGNVAFTPYFASASTGTASSADVWGGERAYLQAVESPYDKEVATNWNTNGATSGTARFSRATLLERFKEKLELDLTDVDPTQWFHTLSANPYGWVSRIQVGPDDGPNTSMRGTWFRETLLAGQSVDNRSLRSQCFTVSYDEETDCFLFDVYGYGHGCGMSQFGAIGYARNGWTYDNILLHYYPHTTLTTY